jgi:hypothetical protein
MTNDNGQELFDDLSRQSASERTSAASRGFGRRSGGRLFCA